MPLYGTVTRLAPAGRHPPEPSHHIQSFMKKKATRYIMAVAQWAAQWQPGPPKKCAAAPPHRVYKFDCLGTK